LTWHPIPVRSDHAVATPRHGTSQTEGDLAPVGVGEQAAFLKYYEALMNQLAVDTPSIIAISFADLSVLLNLLELDSDHLVHDL
jgi:hypothetical protein